MRREVYVKGNFRIETKHILSHKGRIIATFGNLKDAKNAMELLSKSILNVAQKGKKSVQD